MSFPHAHALLMGIGSYAQAPQLNVPITATDAGAVATMLRDPQFCGYPVEQATKAQPNKTLVWVSAEGRKQADQNLAAVLPMVLPNRFEDRGAAQWVSVVGAAKARRDGAR